MNEREKNLAEIRKLGEQVRKGGGLTHELSIDFTSGRGQRYQGTIVVRRPTMKDYLQMGIKKAQMLKDQAGKDGVPPELIDPNIHMLAHMLSTFEVVVEKCPEWFIHPEEVLDFDLLDHIFTKYEDWLANFRVQNAAEAARDSEVTV